MVDAFCGSWKLVDSQNFDEYMTALGVDPAIRDVGNAAQTTVVIRREGDRVIVESVLTNTNIKVIELSFILGEEFEHTTADNRCVKSIITLNGGTLVHFQRWDGKTTTVLRELKGGQMILTMAFKGVEAVRTYDRE